MGLIGVYRVSCSVRGRVVAVVVAMFGLLMTTGGVPERLVHEGASVAAWGRSMLVVLVL